jgi:calcium-translocating P-type ATPase
MFVETFEDATVQVLMVSAAVSLAVGLYEDLSTGWIEGAAIFMAVFIVAIVTAVNNYQKQEQFRQLSYVSNTIQVKVTRDGVMQHMSIENIVVGDLVRVEAGDKIPADGVYVGGSDVSCNESEMTGEPDLITKTVPVKGGKGETSFLISGTTVVSGYCNMLVLRVGMKSSIGLSARPQKHADTPLQEKLTELADQIGYGGMAAAAATFLVIMVMWWLFPERREAGLLQTAIKATILAVAIVAVAVPEGLPLAVVISLAFSSQKMMKDNNLIRHLDACETMGNTTNICSDKTGTLTQNKMTFVEGYLNGNQCVIPPSVRDGMTDDFATAITSNCTATLGESGKVIGNITEGALLLWLDGLGYAVNTMCQENFKADKDRMFTFSSTQKRMSVLRMDQGRSKGGVLYTKGASEKVLEICTHMRDRTGKDVKLDAELRAEVLGMINNMADKKLRVLALAHRKVSGGDVHRVREELEAGLTLDGLFGIKDPLRPDVTDAVTACKSAGIFVRMITGDNINTATAIAKECGILTDGGVAMEGKDFRTMTPAQLDEVIPKLQVLARASPQDKYILVTRLNGNQLPENEEEWKLEHPGRSYKKERARLLPGYREEWEEVYGAGEVVGVTGDGTNDAPALQAANVGLSMGISGTDGTTTAPKKTLPFSFPCCLPKSCQKLFTSLQ